MKGGDISNHMGSTAAWDYRLFIDSDYPMLFKWAVRNNFLTIARWLFSWNQISINNLEISDSRHLFDQQMIVVTHKNLIPLFEHLAPVHLIEKGHMLTLLDCQVLYSSDEEWILAHKKGQHMRKVAPKIRRSNKLLPRILSRFEELIQ